MIEIPRKLVGQGTERDYFDYLKGKRIIIVGPADYLMGQGKGSLIDEYDVIVRLNLGCPVPNNLKVDLGSRTDVLYHIIMNKRFIDKRPDLFSWHTKEQIESWKRDGVNWVVSKRNVESSRVVKFSEVIKGIIPWMAIPRTDMRRLEMVLRTNPNMGTVAIWHILRSKAQSLYVTGCDFHRTGYHPGYGGFTPEQAAKGAGSISCWGQTEQPRVNPRPMHNLEKQLRYLAWIRIRDKRFKADEVLSKMLDEVVI